MEANQILQSSLLEILFDGKNKAYGAYDLRKTYNRRMTMALFFMMALVVILIISQAVINSFTKDRAIIPLISSERTLQKIVDEQPKALTKLPSIVHTASVKVTTPRIVKDLLVIDPPPDLKQIENARIDDHTVEGPKPIGIINPPEEVVGTNVALAPVTRHKAEDSTFVPVEIEASFPGGAEGWLRYIRKGILSQLEDFTDADFGTCVVRFIVDKTGQVSDVQATTMKGSKLAEIAVNAIRKGPKWIPAQQNGRFVNAYRIQPVTLQNPNQ
ncbi:MAG: energy transducer TonB [Ginsengibacter sp.]